MFTGIKPYVPESCCVTEPMWNVNYEKCQTFQLGPPAHTDGERNDHLNYRVRPTFHVYKRIVITHLELMTD